MTRDRDYWHRRIALRDRVNARIRRRVGNLLARLDAHPDTHASRDPELRRLDILVGEADRLRNAL